MIVFEGDSANQVWQQAMLEFQKGERSHSQAGRNGTTNEILHAAFTVRNPRDRWIIARTPSLNPAFAIAEVVWILCGRNDSAFLNFWNSKLPQYSGHGETYHGAYGFRLRNQFGIDQLERAYYALKNNPDGRQVVLQIWDTKSDLPDVQGIPTDTDIPCNIMALLKLRNNKLEWMQITRSNDLFLGVPHNFVQFTLLQEIIAGWLGVEVGSYNHLSDSLHVYDSDQKVISVDSITKISSNTDNLSLPKAQADAALEDLSNNFEAMRQPNFTENELLDLTEFSKLPVAYKNLLMVNSAEVARRKGWSNRATNLISKCTNPILVQVWNRWRIRMQ